jgi:RNA polymerase sigma-70 factor (ECF subfamily)
MVFESQPAPFCVAFEESVAITALSWRGYTPDAVEVGVRLGGEPAPPLRLPLDLPVGDDAELVAAVARADPRALELVYERHSRGVYSLALRVLGDGPAAEEVVQETFLKLWRQPDAYQPSRGRLFTWLLGVAHHRAVDLLRRRQLEERHRLSAAPTGQSLVDLLDSLGLASGDDDPQTRLGNLEQRVALERALGRLPAEQRLALELAYYRGMTQAEIAVRLGEPLGTIKTRMRLALHHLRNAPELSEVWSER